MSSSLLFKTEDNDVDLNYLGTVGSRTYSGTHIFCTQKETDSSMRTEIHIKYFH